MSEEKKEVDPIYEIKLKGHLDTKWEEWFYDMTITHESDGTTTLSGPLPDQTVLHSVLDRIRDMNLTLISALQVQGVPEEELKSNPSEGVPEE
jgi:hypothetical protein